MSRFILDAGAFIAIDRDDPVMFNRLARVLHRRDDLLTHAGIVGQVWRKPAVQARLARSTKYVDVLPLDLELAKSAGVLMAKAGTNDVHDAALALLCEPGDTMLTSDVDDLAMLLDARKVRRVEVIRV